MFCNSKDLCTLLIANQKNFLNSPSYQAWQLNYSPQRGTCTFISCALPALRTKTNTSFVMSNNIYFYVLMHIAQSQYLGKLILYLNAMFSLSLLLSVKNIAPCTLCKYWMWSNKLCPISIIRALWSDGWKMEKKITERNEVFHRKSTLILR